jgi:hypothetical protein
MILIYRIAKLGHSAFQSRCSHTFLVFEDTFLHIALPRKHHESLSLSTINRSSTLQTYRRACSRSLSVGNRSSPSVYHHSYTQLDDNPNLIMRPAVSLLYTTTVLSVLEQALGLWSHPKPLSLQERASIWGLPDCASTCVTSSFGGCNSIDVECICKNKEFLDNLGCCMSKACSKKDQDGMEYEVTLSLLMH